MSFRTLIECSGIVLVGIYEFYKLLLSDIIVNELAYIIQIKLSNQPR